MSGLLAFPSPTSSIMPRFWADAIASTVSAVNPYIDLGIRPFRMRSWANFIDSEMVVTQCSNQSSTGSELCTLTFTSSTAIPEEAVFYLPPKQQYKIDVEVRQITKASPNLVLSDWPEEDDGFEL